MDRIEYVEKICDLIWNLSEITKEITNNRLVQNPEVKIRTNPKNQCKKIIEECIESIIANQYEKYNEYHENMDIGFAWLSLLHIQNRSKSELKYTIHEIIYKFEHRGWINFES